MTSGMRFGGLRVYEEGSTNHWDEVHEYGVLHEFVPVIQVFYFYLV